MTPLGPECSSEDVDESVQLQVLRALWATPAYLERERRARALSVLDIQSGSFLFAEEDIAGPFLPNPFSPCFQSHLGRLLELFVNLFLISPV